jgi:diadenosine tetraphosphatase ApaH/serine/threonine PP2A family protein phosphatase
MRILLIADLHANLRAFEAVLHNTKGQWDYVWCLGDLVGYGPDPNECIELLQTLPHVCVAGNHDWAVVGRLDIRTFNPDTRKSLEWTKQILTPENNAYLAALPITCVVEEYTLVHGSPREPFWEYIIEGLVAALSFPHLQTTYGLVGHSHIPNVFKQVRPEMRRDDDVQTQTLSYSHPYPLNQQRHIISPGSVGQPRDNHPEAAFGVLDTTTDLLELRRVAYDIPLVQQRMRERNLPPRLIERLQHGW